MAKENTNKQAAAQIWLTRKEQQLRRELDQGDRPVLGLYVDHFTEENREYFRSTIIDSTHPVRSFIRGLERWPAAFATFLTVHLVEGYGKSGHAEVYPYIEKALGMEGQSLHQHARESLAGAYRRACLELGLSVVPRGESPRPFVDEYLRQVGVPVSYFQGLFESFAKQAQRVGIPDVDDPNDLAAWEMFADIPSTRPVLRRAVENDGEGYYAKLFFRVSEFQNESESDNAIERAAFQAFQELGQSISKRRALIPFLAWRDDELGVLLPAGDDNVWSIRITGADGEITSIPQIQGGSDPRFVPIGSSLPACCEVVSGKLEFSFPVWQSDTDNQLLIFDRSGKFAAHGRLGGEQILLNPGSYILVSRWKPAELAESSHAISADTALFAGQLDLHAGRSVELTRGPAKVQVVARSVPSLSWVGQRLVGITGKEIYWGRDLGIRISIPPEVLEGAAKGFELLVSRADGEERIVPVAPQDVGSIDLNIATLLIEMGSGLQRVRVRLRRPDVPNRALANATGFAWPELSSVAVGRLNGVSDEAFVNLDLAASDNVSLQGSSLTYRDPTQRFYRTVFKIASEDIAFQWPVPGVFLALEEPKDGALLERPIEKGDVVQVRPSSRQRLKVYSPSDGILRLGKFSQEMRSALFGGAQIYLSNLVEFITPEHQSLRLELPSVGHAEELVRLVTPHQVLKFESSYSSDTYTLNFTVSGELAELSIDARDLLSGAQEELRIQSDRIALCGDPFHRASLTTNKKARSTEATLRVSVGDWEDGAWVLQIQARIDGRWGKLVNARGDVYAGSFRTPMQLNARDYLEENPGQQSIHILGRLVDTLLECYSEPSWRDLKWVEGEWLWIADDLSSRLNDNAKTLLSMAFKRVPETSAESWVPVKSVAAQLIELFGLPLHTYDRFNGASATTNAILGSGALEATRDDELFAQPFFSLMLMFGFANGRAVASGREQHLSGFTSIEFSGLAGNIDESEHRRVRTSLEWAPTAGDLLGIRHYWWALERLKRAFHAAEVQNDFRKGNMLRMASRVFTVGAGAIHPIFTYPAVANLQSLGIMDPGVSKDNQSQDQENLEHIVNFISLVALGARLQVRQPGLLSEIKQSLCRHTGLDDGQLTAVLGFVFYVGMDLFVYYLGLWEFVLARDYDIAC